MYGFFRCVRTCLLVQYLLFLSRYVWFSLQTYAVTPCGRTCLVSDDSSSPHDRERPHFPFPPSWEHLDYFVSLFFVYANEIAPHRGCEHPRIVVSIVERSSLPLNLSVLVKKLASASAWFFSLAQTCWNFFVWIGFRVLRLTLWKILRGRISKWFRLFVGCFFCAESKSGAWRVQQICTCLILRGGKKSVLSPRLRSFLFRKTNYSYLVFVYLVRATSPLPNVMKSYHVFSSYPFYYERIQSCVTGSFTFFHNIFLALAVENLSTCSIT